MGIQDILEKVEKLNIESNYWFVRTDYGKLFEEFYHGGYIAISWDYLTLYEFRNSDENKLKSKIAQIEDIDATNFQGKIKISTIYNKIKSFISLRKDDIIIIPSRNSDRLAFGIIADEQPYEDLKAKEFIKRRKVTWMKIKLMSDLNPIFYKVKSNQHTISNVRTYSQYIDRVMGNLFKKGENTHYVLKIEKTEDISFDELRMLIDNIQTLVHSINETFNFNENTKEFYIKINLQSKGGVELIKNGKSLSILAYLVFLTSCNNLDNVQDDSIRTFIQNNREVLNKTSVIIDSLKMDTVELVKPFGQNGD
jgi:predicted Mrr-cat superfamily restriction endonuclease